MLPNPLRYAVSVIETSQSQRSETAFSRRRLFTNSVKDNPVYSRRTELNEAGFMPRLAAALFCVIFSVRFAWIYSVIERTVTFFGLLQTTVLQPARYSPMRGKNRLFADIASGDFSAFGVA